MLICGHCGGLVKSLSDLAGHLRCEEKPQELVVVENTSTNNESDAILQRYNELLFAVARKFPNETRHQTALRYIQQAEQFDSGSVAKQAHVS